MGASLEGAGIRPVAIDALVEEVLRSCLVELAVARHAVGRHGFALGLRLVRHAVDVVRLFGLSDHNHAFTPLGQTGIELVGLQQWALVLGILRLLVQVVPLR